ncbi:MAG: FAD-dependent oxidoreductase [Ferruginibacter sp.]|nr:FAD-dependent oxidoreductase [Ferruginibacter sp.]
MNRDGACTSIWQTHNNEALISGRPQAGIVYDVIVVGAGITGVTTALLLQHAGKSCILVDAANAGFGTTGGTTAHLNTFYDTSYQMMIDNFGEESARLIAQGARSAIGLIKSNISTYNIECDFEEKDGYLFSLTEKQNEELDEIVSAASKLEVAIEFSTKNPFPIPHLKVARVPGQAQFHPLKYLTGLLLAFQEAGGTLVENCRVTGIKEGEVLEVQSSLGVIRARNSIYATHIPPGVNVLHFRNAPYRSYVLGVKLKDDEYPAALGYDMDDPYHYYRTQEIEGQRYLIAGGEDHKTGHEENTEESFRRLESYVRTYFRVEEISFRWSSQYYEPTDGLPYIGILPGHGSNVYVATGFSGNGMIYGTLAGLILSNLLVNGKSIYEKLLSPGRIKPMAGFSNFVKEGADVVKHLVKSVFPAEQLHELSALANGEAQVVKFEGNIMGLYKDDSGELHAVNSSCPHIKCSVGWNNAEKSWDCPCHGSRFSFDGKLLTAPAVTDLQKVDLTEPKTGN